MSTAAARPLRQRWLVIALLGSVLTLLAISASLVAWLVGSEAGARTVLLRLPNVQVLGPYGPLLGSESGAQHIEVTLRPGRKLVIESPRWRYAMLHWQADAPWRLRLSLAQLRAQRVHLEDSGPPPPATPLVPPAHLSLPLGLDIAELLVDELQATAPQDQSLQQLRVSSLHLGAGPGAQHRIGELSLQWNRLQARGTAQIASTAPLALTAQLRLQPLPGAAPLAGAPPALDIPADWNAELHATGTLEHMALKASVRARRQSLDASAECQPFAPQPVTQLQVQAQRFDIAPFVRNAPFTALTGELRLQLGALNVTPRTLDLSANLRNERATRWGEGGVPVRQLALQAQADAAASGPGRLSALTLELGPSTQAAGRLSGQGTWVRTASSGALQLDGQLELTDVQPAALDARAPALQASGPVRWQLHWPGADAAPVLQALEARLNGRALALRNTPALQVEVSASADTHSFTLNRLTARAGAAQAALRGTGKQVGTNHWQLTSQLSLQAFDPSLWWPGPAGSAWRRGPHRLSGDLRVDLDLPVRRGTPVLDLLAGARGNGELNLLASQLAGVPVSGHATLQAAGPGAAHAPVTADLQLHSGANTITLKGQLDTRGEGAADRWQMDWQTPALETLAPLLRLAGRTAPALSGDSTGNLAVQGRWPHATLRGELRSQQLQAGEARLQQAEARWTLEDGLNGNVDLQAQFAKARAKAQGPALEAVSLRVQGSTANHQAQLNGDITGLATPQNTTAPQSPRLPQRLRAALQAQGAWSAGDATRAPGWTGRIQQAELRDPTEGSPLPVWLRAASLPLQVTLPAAGPTVQLGQTSEDTRLELAGAQLRMERGQWQRTAAGATVLDLRVALEPLTVLPLLTRLQPDLALGGDLRVAGVLDVRTNTDGHLDLDFDLGRVDGDLQVLETARAEGAQPLGLSEARLGLHAHRGEWQLQQNLVGRSLGTLTSTVGVRTAATAWWPNKQDALSGQIDLRVATLGAWALWLPAGWRVNGDLALQARVGGRVGAPEFTGELTGRQMAVYNLVQGVDWHDAALRIALQGSKAQIESFTAQAGAGTLSGSGHVVLADAPQLQLKLTAQKFAALQRIDRRVVVSGTVDVALERQTATASGQVQVDEGRIDISQGDAPALDSDVKVRRGPAPAARTTAGTKREPDRHLAVDLKVNLGHDLRLRGRGVDTLLTGELHVTSPNDRLAVHGSIRTAEGTYAAYAQKLTIDRGQVIFTGAPDNPRLDIEATRPNTEEVRVGVAITGTAQSPRVRLFSEPEMSETDKLSWLVLGRPSDGLGRTDLALLQRAAYALLSGENSGPSVLDRIGLDELSVRQNDGTERDTVVSLGKQLSRRWYVGYERSLNAVAGTWQLVYRAAQRFTLRAQSGAQNSLDMIWSWHWD